ncbi:hypothetical protein VTN31DRAFT_6342 [Thermomyces dupontii]|uniref:uncharacterized protein n=1 Tax=Talaromyces thermophilus TaxID=28565 RepID=UPI0037428309
MLETEVACSHATEEANSTGGNKERRDGSSYLKFGLESWIHRAKESDISSDLHLVGVCALRHRSYITLHVIKPLIHGKNRH